jgi:hypothetical protein
MEERVIATTQYDPIRYIEFLLKFLNSRKYKKREIYMSNQDIKKESQFFKKNGKEKII